MKTLLLSEIFPPKTGGSGRWFWEIYSRLSRDEVTIVAGTDARQAEFDATHDLDVVRATLTKAQWGIARLDSAREYWQIAQTVRKLVKERGIERLHCGRCLHEGWVAFLLKYLAGLPYVCYVHGEDVESAATSRELSWMARRVLNNADFLIANSQNTSRLLTQNWSVSESRVRLLYPGVDTQRFSPAPRSLEVRQRLGWSDRRVVLTVGRLQKRKGHDMLIRALPAIRQAVPDVLYAIAGAGDELASLQALVQSEGVADCVQFLGEPDDTMLIQCYQQCDLFVLANRQVGRDIEGFGMVLLEAQSCGRPVLAGASGGTAETMRIPDTGSVVACDTPDLLGREITSLLLDESRREAMGLAARQWVTSRFDWESLSTQAAELFGVGRRGVGSTVFRNSPASRCEDSESSAGEFRKIVDPTPLWLHNPAAVMAKNVPVSVSVCFPKGRVADDSSFVLSDDQQRSIPFQQTVLAHWSDGSVKWLHVECVAPNVPAGRTCWTLSPDEHGVGSAIFRNSPTSRCDVGKTLPGEFRKIADPTPQLDPTRFIKGTAIRLQTQSEQWIEPHWDRPVRESAGPIRLTYQLDGEFAQCRGLQVQTRLNLFANCGLMRLDVRVRNPHRARHKGGLWDLGDPGSIMFKALVVDLELADEFRARQVRWSTESRVAPQVCTEGSVEIYQDSSGGENWQSDNHQNRDGRVPCRFRGYQVRHGDSVETGRRANPVVTLDDGQQTMHVAVPEFWQQFPKALEADERRVRVGLFPSQWDDLFELQGGEQKTHTIWVSLNGEPLDWVHAPIRATLEPQAYANAGVFPWFSASESRSRSRETSVAPNSHEFGYGEVGDESFLEPAIRGDASLIARREVIDEYGWRNFGEVWADHEQAYLLGERGRESFSGRTIGCWTSSAHSADLKKTPDPLAQRPVISHYNNQFDMVYGAILQFARTGDTAWCDLFDPLARHVADIDIYHTTEDRAAYNGGLFWHTDHYRDAATGTHRCYSRHNAKPGSTYGGGPSCEHNYTTGLLHYYYLTGNLEAREAVLSLANWVLAMDDGTQSELGVVDPGPTGRATATGSADYHGPGRGAGNSVNALLDGWLLTHAEKYLQTAESLIRRVVHPQDDIVALDLLNAEARWSYTVFLSVLARYLELKREAGQVDEMFAYAAASLRHFAQWMLANERPYFDHPEELEFPTETWAAQEMRKANVLRLAALYSAEPLRTQLLQRGTELADRAWSDLNRFESRHVARSIALMMIEGMRDAFFRSNPPVPRTMDVPPDSFPKIHPRKNFVPQKRRILIQAKSFSGSMQLACRLANPFAWRQLVHNVRRWC